MKKWRQFFQSIFIRHIVGPAPVSQHTPSQETSTDLESIRFSVWQYLRGARKHEQFLLGYAAAYATIMDELRMEGWRVELQALADGTLAYLISTDKFGTLA
ncbi:MAG: hypothetical protein EOP49_22810 [Sphingobacteriales bacterium]|nr:MAG: hypothetical protein EOP49_22810 [Sphingobacteriales bacterium]